MVNKKTSQSLVCRHVILMTRKIQMEGMNDMEGSPYCAGLERCKQKITTCWMWSLCYKEESTDFSSELKYLPAI